VSLGDNMVYHFTTTAHLPWIMASGELQPGRNQIGGYPLDFLWATTSSRGARTATAMSFYRSGGAGLVRFSLHAKDFGLWPDILERHPEWTKDHVDRLQASARLRGETDFSRWRARDRALPLSRVVAIDMKTYTSGWKSLNTQMTSLTSGVLNVRGILLGDTVHVSRQESAPDRPTSYAIAKMPVSAWRELAANA
jgi:hypothetical protein